MKKIAVINDLSGFGKCSLTAAIPIISALGVQCCPLTTAVLSNQTGYESYFCKDLTNDMNSFINEWKKLNAEFDGILTGFIANSRQGEIISDFIDSFKGEATPVIVDPVMADDGKIYDCYDTESVHSIISLAEKADIITPNLTELCILCKKDFEKVNSKSGSALFDEIRDMCRQLNEKKQRIVVTSGIHISDNEIANAVFEKDEFHIIASPASKGSFSGTGDILSSFIAARYVHSVSVHQATEEAAAFICKAIEETVKDTNGSYNCCDGVHFEKFLYELGGLNK